MGITTSFWPWSPLLPLGMRVSLLLTLSPNHSVRRRISRKGAIRLSDDDTADTNGTFSIKAVDDSSSLPTSTADLEKGLDA